MCLHLYVSVCILHISCMYVYVCVCIYVPEASQAGRRARRQGTVGRRAARAHPSPSRQAAGWAPAVPGLHVPPALQNYCHPSLNLSPGLPVWQPHGSCFEPCRLHAGHGRTSHSRWAGGCQTCMIRQRARPCAQGRRGAAEARSPTRRLLNSQGIAGASESARVAYSQGRRQAGCESKLNTAAPRVPCSLVQRLADAVAGFKGAVVFRSHIQAAGRYCRLPLTCTFVAPLKPGEITWLTMRSAELPVRQAGQMLLPLPKHRINIKALIGQQIQSTNGCF